MHIGWKKDYTFQHVWFYGVDELGDDVYFTVGEDE